MKAGGGARSWTAGVSNRVWLPEEGFVRSRKREEGPLEA